MWQRWGLGPVFAYEWLMASRRWQMYALRSGFAALLLVALFAGWKEHENAATRPTPRPRPNKADPRSTRSN